MMKQPAQLIIGILIVTVLILMVIRVQDISAQQARYSANSETSFCENVLHGEIMAKTELVFGRSKTDGSAVTEDEFQYFLDTQVTPRFPEGLTLLSGQGQFKNSSGNIIEEGAKLLILLYPFKPEGTRAIEEMRDAYEIAFHQQSVLRVDERSCASF
jgi:hypothetical protein